MARVRWWGAARSDEDNGRIGEMMGGGAARKLCNVLHYQTWQGELRSPLHPRRKKLIVES